MISRHFKLCSRISYPPSIWFGIDSICSSDIAGDVPKRYVKTWAGRPRLICITKTMAGWIARVIIQTWHSAAKIMRTYLNDLFHSNTDTAIFGLQSTHRTTEVHVTIDNT